ncbi:hypothetical protein G6F37_009663 [Rhizopus arrhizus]|nr:hypothetical protein G6F37_009663 [Rhizopus arrhizus]
MVPVESIETFTDRFQRIRRAAKWDDDIKTASIYKRTLPAFLRQEVSRSLLNLGRDQQDSVAKVAAKARKVLPSNLCSEVSPSPRQASVPIKSSSLSLSSNGTEASKYNPRNSHLLSNLQGIAKKSSSPGNIKNKFHCAIHDLTNHPTDRCNKYKDLLNRSPPLVSPSPATNNSSMSFVSVVKKCYRCSGNVPWSRGHVANCPRDKTYHGPSKVIRSARLDSSRLIDNKTNLTVNRQARTPTGIFQDV